MGPVATILGSTRSSAEAPTTIEIDRKFLITRAVCTVIMIIKSCSVVVECNAEKKTKDIFKIRVSKCFYKKLIRWMTRKSCTLLLNLNMERQ